VQRTTWGFTLIAIFVGQGSSRVMQAWFECWHGERYYLVDNDCWVLVHFLTSAHIAFCWSVNLVHQNLVEKSFLCFSYIFTYFWWYANLPSEFGWLLYFSSIFTYRLDSIYKASEAMFYIGSVATKKPYCRLIGIIGKIDSEVCNLFPPISTCLELQASLSPPPS
jgi:hypothetical protein